LAGRFCGKLEGREGGRLRVAILGYGVEGRSAERYFLRRGDSVEVFDENTSGARAEDWDLGDFDLIMRSPSLRPDRIAAPAGKVSSGTKWFFEKCPCLIIGVTGTKGKGTTSTMIKEILAADERNVHLIGNIGVPALDVLDDVGEDDIVVYELSSFQLWDMDRSPQVAVVLRVEADHLDKHKAMEDYTGAKANIAKYQTRNDKVIYYKNNEISREIAELSPGEKIPYPPEEEFDTSMLMVPGRHQHENAQAAILATKGLLKDENSIRVGLANFRAMPHRLELVREIDGVKFYDDSFSASFPSLDVALKAFPEREIILIAGGYDRHLGNYAEIAEAIKNSTAKKVFLIGQTAGKIAEFLPSGLAEISPDLGSAVLAAYGAAESGDIILLSPGAPSFDMFKDFAERGERFQEVVRGL
jgi:UDP-N-acetylmuramoylalanine--D-glutamate ligase